MEKAKMLTKLIAVDSNHFIKYKCKIMHCLDSQTLSEYIWTIALDDNEKLMITESARGSNLCWNFCQYK